MSMLLALTLAAAIYEPVNANAAEFARAGYTRSPIAVSDKKIEGLPTDIAEWNGSAWWQALTWCSTMHGIQKSRLEEAGASLTAILEQQKFNQTYIDLAMARLVADRHITADRAWEEFGEAEDAYWSFALVNQPLNYEKAATTCRLFQSRVERL